MRHFLYGLIGLLMALPALGQEGAGMTLDTNFYVTGVTDWKGVLTVQVLNPMQFAELKQEVALDNQALTYAYQNIRSDWKVKYGKATPTDPKPKIPPFPLKRPPPKAFRLLGKLPTSEAAEAKKTFYEERETARQTRAEAEQERVLAKLSDNKQSALEDKASTVAELTEQLLAEVKSVKMSLEMGLDPSRRQDPNNANGAKSGGKTVTVKQGHRLGEDMDNSLVNDKDLVHDGPLRKKVP